MDFLKARTSADAITERLRDEIVNGTLRPGQQLLQESLSERYGVSRSPLREALRHLEAEGLVIYEANRGATVASYSTDDIMEIFEIRRLLESSAIRQAATAMDAATLVAAEKLLRECKRELDAQSWTSVHVRFHETLYQAAKRPRMLHIIQQHRLKVHSIPRLRGSAMKSFRNALYHQDVRVLRACTAGDSIAAVAATLDHLDEVESRVLESLYKS